MPHKESEARKAYKRQYYYDHLDEQRRLHKRWRDNNKERVAELSKNCRVKCFDAWMAILEERGMLECSKCGYNKCFAALDFHHINPSDKEFGLAKAIYLTPTQARVAELNKVVVLCSNCHRELHSKTYFKDLTKEDK